MMILIGMDIKYKPRKYKVEYWQEEYDVSTDFYETVYAESKEEAEMVIKKQYRRAHHINAELQEDEK